MVRPSPLQTYTSDFSDRLKQTKASTASVIAAEQDAKRGPVRPDVPEPQKGGAVTVIAGILLLALGAGGAYFAYTRYATNIAPIILAPAVTTPLFVDDRQEVAGTGVTLLHSIVQSISRPLAPGAVRLLYLTSTTTPPSVFSALELPAPDILLRNLNDTWSIAGLINVADSQSFFFILSAASYSDTFAGMLTWERVMLRDLSTLFPSHPSAATTTPIFTVFFHDEVVSNHDVRVYRDSSGRSVVLYGYWNATTLVIARDPAAFAEILSRLATSRTQQ